MGFSSVFAMQNIIFLKITTLKIIFILRTNRRHIFFAVLSVDQKINFISPNCQLRL